MITFLRLVATAWVIAGRALWAAAREFIAAFKATRGPHPCRGDSRQVRPYLETRVPRASDERSTR